MNHCNFNNKKSLSPFPKVLPFFLGFLSITILIVYIPSLSNGFVNMDDHSYLTINPSFRLPFPEFVQWAFTTYHKANWHPLTWLSWRADYAIWGYNPIGYHLTNIILHVFNSILIYFFTQLLLAKILHIDEKGALCVSALTALVFGIHPVHVESVTWVSERKDVLFALFYIASAYTYLNYVKSKHKSTRVKFYIISIVFYSFSLLSKPMAVTLPLALIVLDFLINRLRYKKDLFRVVFLEKTPFLLLSLLSAIITISAQGDRLAVISHPLWIRLLHGVKSLSFYLINIFFPLQLSPFYPLPERIAVTDIHYIFSIMLVTIITILSIVYMHRYRMAISAWAFFVLTLLPVLGLVQMGFQSEADRYLYLPMLGPLILAGYAPLRIALVRDRPVITFTIIAILISSVLLPLTIKQQKIWKNSFTLWASVAEKYPYSMKPHTGMAFALMKSKRESEALLKFTSVINLGGQKRYADHNDHLLVAYENRAKIYGSMRKYHEAINDYNHAVALNPKKASLFYDRAIIYETLGNNLEAIKDYKRAISITPSLTAASNNLGNALARNGKFAEALVYGKMANDLSPDNAVYLYNLGTIFILKGELDQGLDKIRRSAQVGGVTAQKYLKERALAW